MPSQCDRILAAARRGPVNSCDFLLPNVLDGGTPITRVPARIEDLETKHGHRFRPAKQPNRTVTYFLTFDADGVESTGATEGAESGVAPPLAPRVASDSPTSGEPGLFPVEGFVSRPDYRDTETRAA